MRLIFHLRKFIHIGVLAIVFFSTFTSAAKHERRMKHSKNPTNHATSMSKSQPKDFTCKSGTHINFFLTCDGLPHCEDGSDETSQLCSQRKCPSFMFRCEYGACTKLSNIQNGQKDCADGSDEFPIQDLSQLHNDLIHESSPKPTKKPTSKATTKHYTPFPYPISTTIPSNNEQPSTSTSSTTKHYTPYPLPPNSPTTTSQQKLQPTTSPTTKPRTTFPPVISKSTTTTRRPSTTTQKPSKSTASQTSPTSTTSTTPTALSISTTSSSQENTDKNNSISIHEGSCALPPYTADKTYNIADCVSSSIDEFCLMKPGEMVQPGVALNFQCNGNTASFNSFCLMGQWVPAIESCNPDCGNVTAKLKANTHVSWQVAIFDLTASSYTCGGVIVSPNAVISASHCFFDTTSMSPRPESDFYITVGRKSRNSNVPTSQIHNITIIQYPPNEYTGDIVILEVTPSMGFTSDLNAVCLDTSENQYLDNERRGMISTYNHNGGGKGYMETNNARYSSYEECSQSVSDESKPLITVDKICVLGQSIEQGNEGSGFYSWVKDSLGYSQYRLRGILSTTFYDSKADGQIAVLTDISKHLSWMPAALNEMNRRHENETLIDVRGPFAR